MRYVLIFLILVAKSAFAAQACDPDLHIFLGEPRPITGNDATHDLIICNEGYVIGYSFHYKAPLWVAYRLTEASVAPNTGRTNDFREDERIPEEHRATLADYRRSGFDRGHMAPRAAMDATQELGSASFLLSNMTPQVAGFNQGGWRDLETRIREIAIDRDEIFVYTGAVFEGVNRTLGRGKIGIPSHLFKIVWDPETEEVFSVLIPNESFDFDDIGDFIVDVNLVESWSGIDFLHALPNSQEGPLESEGFPIWEVD